MKIGGHRFDCFGILQEGSYVAGNRRHIHSFALSFVWIFYRNKNWSEYDDCTRTGNNKKTKQKQTNVATHEKQF